jgi:DNA repair ATPase RecN
MATRIKVCPKCRARYNTAQSYCPKCHNKYHRRYYRIQQSERHLAEARAHAAQLNQALDALARDLDGIRRS